MELLTTDLLPQAQFKMYSDMLTASLGTDGKKRLKGIASSTTKDLHGDTMLETALRDMERDANDNMTIFVNHSYNVPEDVVGSVERAIVVQRGVDGDGNPNWDLDMTVLIDEANPRALKSWEHIQNGTKLGLSIGAMIPEGGATREKKNGTLTIAHVALMETSVVSIPANPRSWIGGAVKALKAAEKQQSMEPDTIEPEVQEDLEPEVQETSVHIEIDTGPEPADPPQDAQQSESENGDSTEVLDQAEVAVTAAATLEESGIDPVVRQTIQATLNLLETTTAKWVETQALLHEEQEARKAAEAQRDETAEVAELIMTQARTIIDKLADTPVGRKSNFKEAQSDLADLDGIYSQRYLRLLQQGQNDGLR